LEHRSHTAPQLLTAHPAGQHMQHDLLQWCHVEAEHLHQEVRAPAMRSILQPWHTGTCCSGSVQNPPRAAMERHARWWSVDSIHVNVTAPLHNIAQCAPHQHTLRAHPTRTHSTARRNTALQRAQQPSGVAFHNHAAQRLMLQRQRAEPTPGQWEQFVCLFVRVLLVLVLLKPEPRAACGKLGKSIVRRERECARC
jgi:hypothetical protein